MRYQGPGYEIVLETDREKLIAMNVPFEIPAVVVISSNGRETCTLSIDLLKEIVATFETMERDKKRDALPTFAVPATGGFLAP